MKVKQLLKSRALKASALLSLSLLSFSGNAQTNVTVDASDTWLSAMLWFTNNTEQTYENYAGDWPLADLKTTLNTTDNTVSLYPNYSAYTAGNPTWSNGELGNKIMLALSYVQDDALVGQNMTFSGTVISNTLVAGYEVKAFVKLLDANYSSPPVAEITVVLDEEGNFTVPVNVAQYPATAHVQYGFMTRGLNANPVNEAAYGKMVIGGGEPEEPTVDTTVSIDNDSELIGYANWFQLDGTTYINGGTWGVDALKTVVNSNNTLDLHPNFSAYGDGTNAEWANGAIGTRVFEGNTYVQDDALAGQTFNYTGHTISNTLATGYTAIAFVKIFDANYANLVMTTEELVPGENFSIVASPAAGSHVQYGYSVTGINANPSQEAALGFARVGQATTATVDFTKQAVNVYPNPATSVLNVTAQDNIDGVQVFNLLGQKVIESTPNQTIVTINVSGLTAGVYIVNTTANGKQSSARFIKQ